MILVKLWSGPVALQLSRYGLNYLTDGLMIYKILNYATQQNNDIHTIF